jgi:RimJ/RimL family protein N-acetyltransferase
MLKSVDVSEAERIRGREPSVGDHWAEGYPFAGDLVAIGGFLSATEQHGEQGPFGYYQIIRRSDDNAIGGIGFKGPPNAEIVEIGYGLIPRARGQGYAAEALVALLTIGREHGVTRARADTTLDNIASQRTLERAGFSRVGSDAELHYYETDL